MTASRLHTHGHEGRAHDLGHLIPLSLSVALLVLGLIFEHAVEATWFVGYTRVGWYLVSSLLVTLPVIREALILLFRQGDVFNELVLMSVAAIGAFAIGEYVDANILMILYAIGEFLEEKASAKARREISSLIDKRPDIVTRMGEGGWEKVSPEQCQVGDKLRLIPGERVSFDGQLVTDFASLDCSALTGESMPVDLERGAELHAGSIVLGSPIELRITKPYGESTLARILQLVEEANENKPESERFIRRFARVYTPIVFSIAALVVLVPYLISLFAPGFAFDFDQSFYNALVVLVTSCPCALIISVPLSYYSGIGAASKRGLIFKGAIYLEQLPAVKRFIFDKTGTLTAGAFEVVGHHEKVLDDVSTEMIRSAIYALEDQSSHPIAQAICGYLAAHGAERAADIVDIREIPGHGMYGRDAVGREYLVGNDKLLKKYEIPAEEAMAPQQGQTAIYVAVGRQLAASFVLEDQIKETSFATVKELKQAGFSVALLSGDNKEAVAHVGERLGVDEALGGLLPQDKITHTERLAQGEKTAFVGDGINDAPVMALCDLSFAMGGIGSDAAIEAADIIIQSDNPYKTIEAVKIARRTTQIAWQNIIFALSIKFVVMTMAIFSFSSLILAIFADVGVTLLAILNAIRVLRYRP